MIFKIPQVSISSLTEQKVVGVEEIGERNVACYAVGILATNVSTWASCGVGSSCH